MSCGSPGCATSIPLITSRAARQPARPFWHSAGAVLSMVRTAHERQRQRRALRQLDDRLLDDIGITREAAEREAAKPFWQA